jgi:hypothetical protein
VTPHIQLSTTDVPAPGELIALYSAVGWSAYTDDPSTLHRAVAGSSLVVTARRAGELVGLARALSDPRRPRRAAPRLRPVRRWRVIVGNG